MSDSPTLTVGALSTADWLPEEPSDRLTGCPRVLSARRSGSSRALLTIAPRSRILPPGHDAENSSGRHFRQHWVHQGHDGRGSTEPRPIHL